MSLRSIQLPASRILLYESRHQPGDKVHEHHHNVHQLLYAIKGDGSITLNGRSVPIRQDDAALIAPQSPHAVHAETDLTLLVLAFDTAVLDPFACERVIPGVFRTVREQTLPPLVAGEFRQTLRKMLHESAATDELSNWAVQTLLRQLLLILVRHDKPFHANANSLRAERIRTYIDERYYEPLSLPELASRSGISGRLLNQIFKEKFGLTPIQYLTWARIEQAKRLLAETQKDIASICF